MSKSQLNPENVPASLVFVGCALPSGTFWAGSEQEWTEDQILADYPELEPADFRAVFDYASRLGRRVDL
jgi:uncharacterized protein (DUF433 family)